MARQTKIDDLPKTKLSRESLKGIGFLLRYLKPYRWKFFVALFALFISSLAGLAFPGLTGKLIDAVTNRGHGMFADLNTITIVLIVALVIQSAFSYVRTYFLMEVSERSLADVRYDVYTKILRLPMSFFHSTRVGELSSRISTDVGMIQMTMTTTLSELIRQTVILVGGISLIAYTSLRLTAVILVSVPILVLLALVFGRMIRKASKRVQDLYARLNTIAEETFQGISVVKAFTAEQREGERYRHDLRELIAISLKVARARGAFVAFIIFVLFGGIVGVIWYGGQLVQTGELSIGDLTSFVLYAVFVGGAMGSFADLYGAFQRALGASERVRDILLDVDEALEHVPEALSMRGHVQMKNVGFAYASRPDIEVLKQITLDIPGGSSLALVGPSGAGKSTLAGLLIRFYEPTSGEIIVDGVTASSYGLAEYRSAIAIVPQDVTLFGGTIAENIGYGKPDASPEEILEAARLANALEFIESFPERFDTIVGERGVQLSGGQRQRVAIARAIIKNPSILILDEATSSLDSESERLVQSALERVMRNRTTVIIAHRLSTIRNADSIAVIQNGMVSESGTYDQLVAMGGLFARLVSMQDRVGQDLIDPGLLY
jgi:ABC-type multidrug transport system fused ATPase/permease subunit